MKLKFFFCYVFLCLVAINNLYAAQAPSVNNISGVVQNGKTLTIIGSDFGSKLSDAPLRFDNFENGTLGAPIPNNQDNGGWSIDSPNHPIYSNTESRYPGRKAALQRFGNYYGQSIALNNRENSGKTIPPGTKELYVSGWFWMETGGALSRNAKIINMGTTDAWQTRVDVYPTTNSGHLYAHTSNTCGSSSSYLQNWSTKPNNVMLPDKQWHRIETYLRIGQNGYRDLWIDGEKIADISGAFTGASCDIGYLLIGHYFAVDTGSPKPWANRYWDELYVDTTRARIEIGNAPVWSECKQKEIQVPTSWSDKSITVRLNLGPTQAGERLYLYVVDKNGNVNNQGYPLTQAQHSPVIKNISAVTAK